jgi:Protein kinase domain/PEGA domain
VLQSSLESPLPFDESTAFIAPSAFGPFRVLHQIGSGVLGPVFRTYDPQHDRLVAVKAFRLQILPEQVGRLADALRRLASGAIPAHPGIVSALDAGFEGTTPYLASEYVTAETLDIALRHLAPAPIEQAVPLISQIAGAIDAGWAAGAGHGTLHPRDIFVTADGQLVRLTGIGVAQAIEGVGVKAPARRPYTAPERINGESWDIRADVYTLGAIAHELLTRRRPGGSGDQDGALAGETAAGQRVQIRRVLAAALAERPAGRFESARAFAEALAAAGRGEMPAGSTDGSEPARDVAAVEAAEAPVFVVPSNADRKIGASMPMSARPPASEATAVTDETGEGNALTSEDDIARVAQVAPHSPATARQADGPIADVELDRVGIRAPAASVAKFRTTEHPALSTGLLNPPATADSTRASFPWSALAAVAAAGIAVGIVIGYQIGRHAVGATAGSPPPLTSASAQTDVPVPLEPVVPAEPPSRAQPPATESTAPSAPRAAHAAASGRIVVRSTPSGALVIVDGRPRGETPLTVTDLALGRHTIDVARSGFVPHRDTTMLTAGDPSRTLAIQLEAGLPMPGGQQEAVANATAGSMFIDSHPQAARVMIDGRFAGMTPLRVPEVRAGNHVVRIERTGFGPFSRTVEIQPGQQVRVTAALEERQEQ